MCGNKGFTFEIKNRSGKTFFILADGTNFIIKMLVTLAAECFRVARRFAEEPSAFMTNSFVSRKNPCLFPTITANYTVAGTFNALVADMTGLRISES